MNIAPFIISLSESQRTALLNVISLISSKKKIKSADLKDLVDDTHCTGVRVQRCLGVSREALNKWVNKESCPRNQDGTYSLPEVIKWRVTQIEARYDQPIGLKEEKLKKEIEFLQTRINEKNDTTMDRELHETILVSRAGSLRTFFEKTFMSNAIHLAGKTVDEVRAVLYDLLKSAMDAYLGKGE
jgi:hypothetical protein